MKLVTALFLFSLTLPAFAQERPFMTVKERLRLLLWTEGLNEHQLDKKPLNKPARLKEEIERPLRKI